MALLERSSHGVRLTGAGHALTSGVRPLHGGLSVAMGRARLASAGRLGTVRIALGRLALDDAQVGAAISSIAHEEPWITLQVREIPTQDHTRALLAGDVHLALGTEETPHHRGLDRRTLRSVSIKYALLAESHPLAGREVVTSAELADLLLLVPGRTHGYTFPRIVRAMRDIGLSEPLDCDTLETAYALAAAGEGWVPATELQDANPPFGLASVRVEGLDVELPLVVRWRRGGLSAVEQRVARLVVRAYRGGSIERPAAFPSPRPHVESGLELRHLSALLAVANDGSLTDAAHTLQRTKSAVSRQISALERIVGASLVERRGHALALTVAGAVMRDAARATVEAVQASTAAARLAHRGVSRKCTIGIVPTPLTQERMRSFLRRAATEFPGIALEVREMGSPQIPRALARGEIDGAILLLLDTSLGDPSLEARHLVDDPLDSVLVAAGSDLARRVALSSADLAERPFLFMGATEDTRFLQRLLVELRRVGIDPRIGSTFEGPRALWRFVAHSDGWTLGVRSMRALPPSGLIAVPAVGFSIPTALYLVSRRGEPDARVRAVLAAI